MEGRLLIVDAGLSSEPELHHRYWKAASGWTVQQA